MLHSMAYTVSDLEAIDAAITGGELTVRHGDKWVTYRSMEELLMARKHVAAQIAAQQGRPRFSFATARFDE
jgi:metallophosphoesterase superfamily enzyme